MSLSLPLRIPFSVILNITCLLTFVRRYDDEDIQHMRKVVAYCKRHLAQEGKAKQDPNSKSARSLKNWGHDPQKT